MSQGMIVIVGIVGAALGWIVRSIFDIFYVNYRDRVHIENAIASDLESIYELYKILCQSQFIDCLAERNFDQAKKISALALVRSKTVNINIIQAFGNQIFKIPAQKKANK